MAITMKSAVFWDVTACGSCKNQRFGGTCRLHHQGYKNRRVRNNVSSNQLLVTANFPGLPILFTLMMEAICYSETLGFTRPARRHIQETALFIVLLFIFPHCQYLTLHVVNRMAS
jgi:hypothetical protein